MYNPGMDAIRMESALINIQLNFDELATGTKDFFDKFRNVPRTELDFSTASPADLCFVRHPSQDNS